MAVTTRTELFEIKFGQIRDIFSKLIPGKAGCLLQFFEAKNGFGHSNAKNRLSFLR